MRSNLKINPCQHVLMPVKHNVFPWNLPDVEEVVPHYDGENVLVQQNYDMLHLCYLSYSPCLFRFLVCFRFSSGLHGNTAADSVRSGWPLWHAAKTKQLKLKRKLLN
ncbi:hypothetical protein TNCV_596901 [Trichonephila clavipes]|nr:hypothetical protein TNCV_596901 [Trichonephila clavipes]